MQQLSVFVNKVIFSLSDQTPCNDEGCAWLALQRDSWLSSSVGKQPLVGRAGGETLPYWGAANEIDPKKPKSLVEDGFYHQLLHFGFSGSCL